MRGRKYTESGTICKGDTRGTVGKVREHGPDMWEARESSPGCAGMRHYMGVTSTGKPGGCKCVKSSGMLEGSPECAGVCGECTMRAGKHRKCADIAEMVRRVRKCTGVCRSTARPGMRREVESVRKQ